MYHDHDNIHELTQLHNVAHGFRDRSHAGQLLAQMLAAYRHSEALVLAIPAGGVPVAAEIAKQLGLPLDVAVVSKITLPWSSEAGYGAVAFDGSVQLNQEYVSYFGLDAKAVREGICSATQKVQRRVRRFHAQQPPTDLSARTIILVDDGLASGITLHAAVTALRQHGATKLIVAIPTGQSEALQRIAKQANAVYCANIRTGYRFAVADAYEHWNDISEDEAVTLVQQFVANTSGQTRQHNNV